jgi:hypothetical protein
MKGVVVALLLCLSGLLAGCTDFGSDGAELSVQGIDVSAPEVGAGRLVLAVLPTIDNDGGRSGPLNVTVKAYDGATGLLVGSSDVAVGRIPKDQTRTLEARIELPRASGYRLVVEIEESGRLVHRAQLEARNLASLQPNVHETGLGIAASDFRLLSVANNRTRVQASIYLTNEGTESSRPLTLQVRAREEKTLLVVDEQWTSVGSIRRDATRPINVTLELPAGRDYGIEVTLWDGDIVAERGTGRVQFGPVATAAPPTGVTLTTPELTDLLYDRGAQGDTSKENKAPGLGLGLVAAAMLGLALVARRRLR